MNSLPGKWLTFSQGPRNANQTQTLDLADIYGRSSEEHLRDLDIEYRESLVAETFDWDEEEVFDEGKVTQVKVMMALADDELTIRKSHACNGEWVDIIIRKILKAKAKPFPPCTHCGFNDHILNDCRNYPERGSNESSIGVKFNTCESTIYSTTDHNEFDHFKRETYHVRLKGLHKVTTAQLVLLVCKATAVFNKVNDAKSRVTTAVRVSTARWIKRLEEQDMRVNEIY
nr:hypothetical protein [Tanacetum cinerariifolium]